MTIMDTPVPNNEIECVIVSVGVERTWYDRAYDPDDKSPPECYAQKMGNDDTFNPTMIPATNVPEPPAKSCAECDNSKMGSAKQGKGPACKTRRRIAVIPASHVNDPSKIGTQVVLVSVPPTSGQNFSKHINGLSAQGLPPEAAITKIKYGPSRKVMFEMTFEAVQPIEDEDFLRAIFPRVKGDEWGPLLLAGYSYEEPEEEPANAGKVKG